jgi:hypothetical protein
MFLQSIGNKGDNLQGLQNAGVMFIWIFGRHNPEAGGFCLALV